MIRFPNRFHASNTPRIAQVESFWREEERVRNEGHGPHTREYRRTSAGESGRDHPHFDFSEITKVLG